MSPDGWAEVSVGVDLAEVKRIRAALTRWGDRFLTKHFTRAEITYCLAKARPAESLAARFAAKEAFLKAYAGGESLRWHDVEIEFRDGKPTYRLHGAAAACEAKLSLTHTHGYAVAVAMVRPRRPRGAAEP